MSAILGKRAIVIGSGIAGLAAAGTLAGYFESVVVLERDAPPEQASPRQGVPQSSHPHALLIGGQLALFELFPGFDQELADAGALQLNAGLDTREEWPGFDPFPQRDTGWITYFMSRPLIELTLRQRVRRQPNVEFHYRCRVDEIVAGSDGSAVGVRCDMAAPSADVILADLVVDASGRGALTHAFLRNTNRPEPEQETIAVDVNYATAIFEIPEGSRDWSAVLCFPDMRTNPRAGYLLPIEDNRWMSLVAKWHGNVAPADAGEFVASTRELRTNTIHDAIKQARMVDRVRRFGFSESAWRHYEALEELPRGLLPIGDAICRFNPIYGQGMTVAAQEARFLKGLLESRCAHKEPLVGLGKAFVTGVAPLIAAPWAMAAVPDFLHPQTRGARPQNLDSTLQYMAALRSIAARDPTFHRLLLGVRHLALPQETLRAPELAERVAEEMIVSA
jgi:2-polyprenyl-6-methoxyphenol hydroxylase-like FAD-dependent oxidoreductase